jgi:hypothetical protein
MQPDNSGLALHIRDRALAIESAKVSVTKWHPISELVAEASHVDPEDVYVTTVSKPGNLSVRLEQSRKARDASIVVIMYTGIDAELERCVEAAAKRCVDRRMLLIFADNARGNKTLAAIVKPTSETVPVEIADAYPAAPVVDC